MIKQAIIGALLGMTLTAGTMPIQHKHLNKHAARRAWVASHRHEIAERSLAGIMFGECRGQGATCMLMIGHVAMNRAKENLDARYGHGLWGVIHKHKAYSCLNKSDPNRHLILLAEADKLKPGADKAMWLEAKMFAHMLMHRALTDPTLGATHYYAVSMPTPPKWIHDKHMTHTVTRDGHSFWRKD